MDATQFCYWLQGLFELGEPTTLDEVQVDLIKRHLAMAFEHDIDRRPPVEEQKVLNNIHAGTTPAFQRPKGMRC